MTSPERKISESAPSAPSPPAESPPAQLRRTLIESQAYYYHQPPVAGAGPAPVLVSIHGMSQTAEEFQIETAALVPAEFASVAPQGPNQHWAWKKNKITFSWITAFEKEDSMERNTEFLRSMLESLFESGLVARGSVFLAGFSQGSAVAYRFAHRYPDDVCGVISICSDLPPDVEADLTPLRNVPVMVAYGLKDRLMAKGQPEAAIAALQSGGIAVEEAPMNGGHGVAPELGPAAQAWMRRHLAARNGTPIGD